MHAFVNTLSKVAMKITDDMFELWDKTHISVALTITKLGKYLVFMSDREETVEAIVRLVKLRT